MFKVCQIRVPLAILIIWFSAGLYGGVIHSWEEFQLNSSAYIEGYHFNALRLTKGHEVMRSKILGGRSLLDLADRYDINSVIFVNKSGFYKNKKDEYLGLEEYLLKEQLGIRYFHPFGMKSVYVDGKNPLFERSKFYPLHEYLDHYAARAIFNDESLIANRNITVKFENIMNAMRIVLNKKNQPILIHCSGGKHRTGMLVMLLRWLQGGWWINGPKASVRFLMDKVSHRYEDQFLSPLEYEYFLYARGKERWENIEFIRSFITWPEYQEFRQELISLYNGS